VTGDQDPPPSPWSSLLPGLAKRPRAHDIAETVKTSATARRFTMTTHPRVYWAVVYVVIFLVAFIGSALTDRAFGVIQQ
jgi:hypothetical protein